MTIYSGQKFFFVIFFLVFFLEVCTYFSFLFSVERSDITCELSFANTEVTPDPKNGVCCLCRNGKSQQKFAMACAIVLCLAITWVASAQLCRETYIPGQFLSPLLCLYFWSSWLIFFYPVYVGIELLVSKGDFPVGQTFRFVVNIIMLSLNLRYQKKYLWYNIKLIFNSLMNVQVTDIPSIFLSVSCIQ